MVRVRIGLCASFVLCVAVHLSLGATTRPRLPGAPKPVSPLSGAIDVGTTPTLSWSARSATSYDVYFGTATPLTRVATRQTATSYTPAAALANGVTYYWQIVAFNSDGSTSGSQWSFTTIVATLAPPATPSAPS